MNRLQNIRIVLVETSHPGNIGAAARAMKTMGLSDLALVTPWKYPDEVATTRAAGAVDVLENAQVFEDLQSAIADCEYVVGTTARVRRMAGALRTPREAAEYHAPFLNDGKLAIVFGREKSGLTNEELALCQSYLNIPSNPEYSSLNLASAVQLASYECRVAALALENAEPETREARETVDMADMERFYEHLEEAMKHTGYHNPSAPRYLMRRMRILFSRAELDRTEVNILRGFFSTVLKHKDRRQKQEDA